jgi:hypothetical protein
MRRAWLALVAAGAMSAAVAMPAAAREFPYCIRGCDFGAGAGDCSFSSLSSCAANPYFNAKADMQNDRSRRHGRRF